MIFNPRDYPDRSHLIRKRKSKEFNILISNPKHVSRMNCDEYFSVFSLNAWSQGNEIFITNECIHNGVKLFFFSVWLLVWIGLFCWSLGKIIRDVVKKRWSWNSRRKVYLITLTMAIGQILIYSAYLAGFHQREKYLAYAIAPVLARFNGSIVLRAWFKTISDCYTQESTTRIKFYFKLANDCMDVLALLIWLSCSTVGLMVSYPNPENVNWFYIFGIGLSSINGFGTCVLLIVAGNRLKTLCQPNEMLQNEDGKLQELSNKIRKIGIVAWGCIGLQFAIIVIPVWMVGDLFGIFYFHFILNETGIFLAGFLMMFLFTKFGKALGASSDHITRSGSGMTKIDPPPPPSPGGFTFTVEQLTTVESV